MRSAARVKAHENRHGRCVGSVNVCVDPVGITVPGPASLISGHRGTCQNSKRGPESLRLPSTCSGRSSYRDCSMSKPSGRSENTAHRQTECTCSGQRVDRQISTAASGLTDDIVLSQHLSQEKHSFMIHHPDQNTCFLSPPFFSSACTAPHDRTVPSGFTLTSKSAEKRFPPPGRTNVALLIELAAKDVTRLVSPEIAPLQFSPVASCRDADRLVGSHHLHHR